MKPSPPEEQDKSVIDLSKLTKEKSSMEVLQELIGQGWNVTRVFPIQDNAKFEEYLTSLKSQGKQPHTDYKFLIGENEKVRVLEK